MVEIMGKDGVIYYLRPYTPGSDMDYKMRELSDVERRVVDAIKGAPGLKRDPRIILTR